VLLEGPVRACCANARRYTGEKSLATAGPFGYEAGDAALERAPASMGSHLNALTNSAIAAGQLRDADEHHNNAIDQGEPVPPSAPHAWSCPPS
jgi:hypothetical protein